MEPDIDCSIIVYSWSGILGAAVTVLITTLDDSIWLVSFVGTSSLPKSVRLVNAATFLSSLMGLALLCCALAVGIEEALAIKTSLQAEHLERTLQWIAVIFCWLLAAGFYIRKQLKMRRRRQEESRLRDDSEMSEQEKGSYYGSVPHQESSEAEDAPRSSQPCAIVLLTTLGFLDEISYFPALIVGKIFSVWELCLGTLFAGIVMLGIQGFLASQCKPLIDCLDNHVKLHGIIAIFALILTINLILDYSEG